MGKFKRTQEDVARAKEIIAVLLEKKIFTGASPEKVTETLTDLGPTFIKLGQILSTRPDIVSKEYCDAFKSLCADVRPMDFETVREIITESTGKTIEEQFDELDEKPLGSASMAQVHRAKLKTGEDVVVKVQRRGIHDIMERDVHLMHTVVKLLPPNLKNKGINFHDVIDEFWKAVQEEMDFLNEADDLSTFYKNCETIEYATCPKPYRDYSTEKVLVMEAINGIPLDQKDELVKRGYDLNEIGTKIADHFIRQVMTDGFFHADPHQGNIMIREGKIVWIDLGMVGKLSKSDKMEITKAIIAVSRNDIAGLVDFVYAVGIYKEHPERTVLYTRINNFMAKYVSTNLSSIDLAMLFTELTDVLRENNIEMPGNFTLLIKGLATVEGVVAEIAPDIQIIDVAKARVRAEFLSVRSMKNEMRKETAVVLNALMKAVEIPSLVTDLIKSYSNNETRIRLDLTASDSLDEMVATMTSKVVYGLIAAALLIASSVMCMAKTDPVIGGMPILAIIGFIIAFAIIVFLTIGHVKRRKRKRMK